MVFEGKLDDADGQVILRSSDSDTYEFCAFRMKGEHPRPELESEVYVSFSPSLLPKFKDIAESVGACVRITVELLPGKRDTYHTAEVEGK